MDEELTEEELQQLKDKLGALSDQEVLEQNEALDALFDLRMLQDRIDMDFIEYHKFWTKLLADEMTKRGM